DYYCMIWHNNACWLF
nr:immunoglobulin light chain junction region [Macaca mulatta]